MRCNAMRLIEMGVVGRSGRVGENSQHDLIVNGFPLWKGRHVRYSHYFRDAARLRGYRKTGGYSSSRIGQCDVDRDEERDRCVR